MSNQKSIEIVGGGTLSHVRNHLALAAPAYGTTARTLAEICKKKDTKMDINLHLTRMCHPASVYVTPEDLMVLVRLMVSNMRTKVVFWNPAIADFEVQIGDVKSSARAERLTSKIPHCITLQPSPKLINEIRKNRKDIFLVGFKTTTGKAPIEQYKAGLEMLKQSSSNLVLANDVITRTNLIIVPEEAAYITKNPSDREAVLEELVDMALLRSHLTFTRSTVVDGEPIPWNSTEIPNSLRDVVHYCIIKGAYRKFLGVTAGHFAVKLTENTFLTSRRKTDFNDIAHVGLVKIMTDGQDSVIAYGSKPSVGGQSQRIVFHEHPGLDCIVHFHCERKFASQVPIVSQREYECGSHECGKNTSRGLKQFGNLKAVYLENHGPNIVFPKTIDPQEVINFIEDNFALDTKTGGFQV